MQPDINEALDLTGNKLTAGDLVYHASQPNPLEPYVIESIVNEWIKLKGINVLFEAEDFYLATT